MFAAVNPNRRSAGARDACRYPIYFAIALALSSTSAQAEIQATDCARAAKYSESKRGASMLVIQNGRTIF
jgi:hypothetical protein